MPLGEAILGTLGELIGYAFFELIIEGLGKLIRGIYYGIRKLITGKEREVPELKRIEKRYLYKKFRLRSDFNEQILKGTRGTVMQVIDAQNLFVEFETPNGEPIMVGDEQTFRIKRKGIILERKNRV